MRVFLSSRRLNTSITSGCQELSRKRVMGWNKRERHKTMSQYLLAIPSYFRSQAPAWSNSRAGVEDIDAALYHRHIEGDDAAFVELFNRHNHRLYVYCLK